MGASKEVKDAGVKSLAHACKVAEVNRNTAMGWYKNKPKLFKVFVAGVKSVDGGNDAK